MFPSLCYNCTLCPNGTHDLKHHLKQSVTENENEKTTSGSSIRIGSIRSKDEKKTDVNVNASTGFKLFRGDANVKVIVLL